jgi:subtilisin family serine protease
MRFFRSFSWLIPASFWLLPLAQLAAQASVDPSLYRHLAQQPKVSCWLLLTEEADLAAAAQQPNKTARGQYVWQALQATAQRSQAPILERLRSQGIDFQPFYIVNAIHLPAVNAEQLAALSQWPELQKILPNQSIRAEFPRPASVTLRDGTLNEWGPRKMQVPRLWELGIAGQGVVIGGQDTGYDWEHPAIKSRYRGWDGQQAQHDYHWHDAIHGPDRHYTDSLNPCGFDVQRPCDDGSHGTHTMGTMVGDGGPDRQFGLAPQAKWIGCRNMERGWGTPATYIECFEWFLAPTNLQNQAPNPALAPHVINNSWGCPPDEGCEASNFEMMRRAVANLRAAGVVVVVSAGNDGPQCETVRNPASIFDESFSVGATNIQDSLARFSSRGPVRSDGSGRLKPDVAAPGEAIYSCTPGNGYALFSGTSMAGPHVAGLVALLISADTSLAGQVERIEELIERSAYPLIVNQTCDNISGQTFPNPMVGHGRVDAWRALQLLRPDLTGNAAPQPLLLMPNPSADGQVLLQCEENMGKTKLRIFNPLGQLMHQEQSSFVRLQRFDFSHLPSGFYLIELRSELTGRRLVAKWKKGF